MTSFELANYYFFQLSYHFTQWCSGSGATGAIAPVPFYQGGAPLQFLFHLFLVYVAYIWHKLAF